jgi:micrococcal nuclease
MAVACLTVIFDCAEGSGDNAGADNLQSDATVRRIVDGDTLEVVVAGEDETVRLIGINSPEHGECLADVAADRLAELVEDREVRLESDVSNRDQFERLLRYVWVDDVLVNERLVSDGMAVARRYPPDTARAAELEAAEARAREAGRGIWDPEACGEPSGVEVRIGEIAPDPPGDDVESLNEEWVVIENRDSGSVDLTGWGIRDESARNRYEFPDGFRLAAGQVVRLRSGCGEDTDTDLHWCSEGAAVWNNDGDTVFLIDPAGNVADSRSY